MKYGKPIRAGFLAVAIIFFMAVGFESKLDLGRTSLTKTNHLLPNNLTGKGQDAYQSPGGPLLPLRLSYETVEEESWSCEYMMEFPGTCIMRV